MADIVYTRDICADKHGVTEISSDLNKTQNLYYSV